MKKSKAILITIISIMMLVLAGCMNGSLDGSTDNFAKSKEQVILYIPNEAATGVIRKTVEMDKNDVNPVGVLNKLIAEENKDEYSVFPKNLKVEGIKVEDGLAYVEFNEEFLKAKSGGSLTERLELASIVNTLTELKNIKSVIFIVKGEPVLELNGHVDMTDPLTRFDDLIVEK